MAAARRRPINASRPFLTVRRDELRSVRVETGSLQPGRGLDVLAASPPAFALRIMPGKEITICLWPLSHPHFRLVNASE
jgi:hypothetical protein